MREVLEHDLEEGARVESEMEGKDEGEVVERLRMLERKANVLEVLLQSMAWKSFGVGPPECWSSFQ